MTSWSTYIDTVRDEREYVTVTEKCEDCGREFSIRLTAEDFARYENNADINSLHISRDDKLLLLTQTCHDCMFEAWAFNAYEFSICRR